MKYFTLALTLAVFSSAMVYADVKETAGNQDVIFFGSTGPVLIRLQIEIDGKPADTVFRDYLKKWVAYADRDGDKKLDATEVRHLPPGKYASNFFRIGYFYYNTTYAPKMSDFGKNNNETVTVDDLLPYYAKYKMSGILHYQTNTSYYKKNTSNDLLYQRLDVNKDGKLSKQEVSSGLAALQKFDLNDDELITEQEMTNSPYPNYYGGNVLIKQPAGGVYVKQTSSVYVVPPNQSKNQLAILLLAKYDKNKDTKLSLSESGLEKTAFAKLDSDEDQGLNADELGGWRDAAKVIPLVVRLGKMQPNQSIVDMNMPMKQLPKSISVSKIDAQNVHLLLDEAKIAIHGKSASGQMMAKFGTYKYLYQQFQQASKNKGFATKQDLAKPQFKLLERMLPMFDKNGDDKLTQPEFEEFDSLQQQARVCYASLQSARRWSTTIPTVGFESQQESIAA